MKGLYVHIPFCKRKCYYCDFNSIVDLSLQDEYVNMLIKEIYSYDNQNFDTIFIGGGTPTILSIENMEKVLYALSKFNSIEFTVEANPGTLTREKLLLLKKYGVNRLSIGLQSINNLLLKQIGRIHTFEEFLENYTAARDVGFSNINVDLMFNLPNQSINDFLNTLDCVIELNPEHISCYSLIIEEDTNFFDLYQKDKLKLLDEEEERYLYHQTYKILKKCGYNQYEISNYAKEGYECKHNIIYWTDEYYIGVGAGAHSYIDGIRYSNYKNVKKYIEKVKILGEAKEDVIELTKKEHMSEFMFLGLRMNRGININRFKEKFDIEVFEVYGKEINELIDKGLLEKKEENIRLTEKGKDLSNLVFVYFLK